MSWPHVLLVITDFGFGIGLGHTFTYYTLNRIVHGLRISVSVCMQLMLENASMHTFRSSFMPNRVHTHTHSNAKWILLILNSIKFHYFGMARTRDTVITVHNCNTINASMDAFLCVSFYPLCNVHSSVISHNAHKAAVKWDIAMRKVNKMKSIIKFRNGSQIDCNRICEFNIFLFVHRVKAFDYYTTSQAV